MKKEEAPKKGIPPSQFMRNLRPELYSDSTPRVGHQLKAEVLSHHLDTITERNQTHDFELFCRKLCERTICPNLRPATGPEGGGDSKADTETLPVSEEINILTYIGTAHSGSERWAFAFSAKKAWAGKVRSDVAGIMATNRGYSKIFFVTSRAARAKDRSRVEDELSKQYGVQITIHDRSWILKEVIENNRRDLAYHYLGFGEETRDLDLGPSDYSRKQQLADIEKELADPEAFAGMQMQRATEAIVAAKLARSLELPRTDVDGRFLRAVRLADDGGTRRQQLTAQYEMLWTAYWWFDDIKAVVDGYDGFEALVLPSDHACDLEMLCNLVQLLFNAVVHNHRTPEQAALTPRVARLTSRLTELASNIERPNNALEAKVSLLAIRVNEALIRCEPERLGSLWPQFGDILAKADGLGEFDANRLTHLIEVFGQVAGKDRRYRDLVDQVSDFVTRRTGESQGAKVLLKRAEQLDFDENMEMIRLLGKAVRLLSKKEHVEEFVDAQVLLAVTYQSAGLLWAARASSTVAAATLFIEADQGNNFPASIFPTLMNVAWQAVELKHFPEVLETIQVARGCLKALRYDDDSVQRAAEQLRDLDLTLGCQIANLGTQELSQLEMLPDILGALDLHQSEFALLYRLGYEDLLRSGGWIPDGKSAQEVSEFFRQMASQPVANSGWRPAIFNGQREQVFATSVLGVQVNVAHEPTDTCITVAEAIVGTIEAFFATAFELGAIGHAERFDVTVVEEHVARSTIDIDIDRMRATVSWPCGVFPGSPLVHGEFLRMLLEVAATAFSATCRAKNFEEAAKRLFKTDAAMNRVAMIGALCLSRQRIFHGVARLTSWDRRAPKRFEIRPDAPQIEREPGAAKRNAKAGAAAKAQEENVPKLTDHRDMKVHSVIDIHLWDRAGWMGTAYGIINPKTPPFMALLFKDKDAARKIFERWRERFGEEDKEEGIHIGVVRQFSAADPAHYGMVITSRIPDDRADSRLDMLAIRMQTMEPSDDANLLAFLDLYKRAGAYLLMPATVAHGKVPQFIDGLHLVKRSLHVKIAADVGTDDPESVFLKFRGHMPN